ncbi:MAG: septum formation protein Maf [Candidatus Abyssobacteria bacterium SURF_17]|uniref:dTTP/UTP pyrophosphatase n=1 Tax=Candidatus Abyssobacteria bacterium SURF_17 TaxID=2093361 RepID=A0A419F2A1_9BACT|nr:MAG: septum formation protein Maf [Candidatus Abyssubacteria bacterium SURF_17]
MSGYEQVSTLILASTSPRRIDLLRSLGIAFELAESEVGEEWRDDIPIAELVERNALAKASSVARKLERGLVIGADTVVSCEGAVFGKPSDIEDARRMLRALAGRTHQVYSGVAVVRARDGTAKTAHAITDVTFRPLSEKQIAKYLQMIDPLDKAGAYAIQGVGGIIVEKICGCYYNVVGLPLTVLDNLLAHFGVQLL